MNRTLMTALMAAPLVLVGCAQEESPADAVTAPTSAPSLEETANDAMDQAEKTMEDASEAMDDASDAIDDMQSSPTNPPATEPGGG